MAVVLADVPREKNRQRFESLKGLNAGVGDSKKGKREGGWGERVRDPSPSPSFTRLPSRGAEPKLKITHKKPPATYTQGKKFVPYISGRLSLFLDPSEAESLSLSLDTQGEKMSWS